MRSSRLLLCFIALALSACVNASTSVTPSTSKSMTQRGDATYNVLYRFRGTDAPTAGLVAADGSLYGTTVPTSGNAAACIGHDCGTIFELTKSGSRLRETVLHTFSGGEDGADASGGLIFANAMLYGTTIGGGLSDSGTVFSITPTGSHYSVLYRFTGNQPGSTDGVGPVGLTALGDTLYGVTSNGGSRQPNGEGTVFAFRRSGGAFAEGVLHSFGGGRDGTFPNAGLVAMGNTLYGTTPETIFGISQSGAPYRILRSIPIAKADFPSAPMIVVGDELVGTSANGGSACAPAGCGTVFSTESSGAHYIVLHSFRGGSTDGADPEGALLNYDGALYGTTVSGGGSGCGGDGCGTIYRINANGMRFAVLHRFGGDDGANPRGALTAVNGLLYGATMAGGGGNGCGGHGCGTVFSIAPSQP